MKKKLYISAITLVIAGLMISGATAAFIQPVSKNTTVAKKTYSIAAAHMGVPAKAVQTFSAKAQSVQPATLNEEQARSFVWMHKYQPAVAESHDGMVAGASRFQRDDINIVGWCGSAWDAVPDWYPYPEPGTKYQRLFNIWWPPNTNWSSVLYWTNSNGCHHPAMDFRGFNGSYPEFVGTMVSIDNTLGWKSGQPFVTHVGNSTYPNVREAYSGSSWDFSVNGWFGMKSADIAADTTDTQFWRWGIMSLVLSNQTGLQDGPALFFQYNDTGYGTLSYFIVSGAETTHCDIDEAAQMAYSVYDYYSAEAFQYELFVRTDNWAEMKQYTGTGDWTTSGVTWSFNDPALGVREPAVAAANGNLVIASELTNDSTPNDIDIICWYTPDGNASNLNVSVIAGSTSSEKHPEIQYVGGSSFVCAFYNNSKVYRSRSNDGGATWSTPVLVSGTDTVLDGAGCIDVTNGGTKVFWTNVQGNTSWVLNCARLETHIEITADEIWDGATTCPHGDAIYNYITVTVWNANGNPVAGIPAASFAFTITPQGAGLPWVYPYTPRTQYVGTFGATFVPVDAQTNANGQIRFAFRARTAVIGDVLITATVNGQPIKDRERLPCKTLDYTLTGDVGLGDFAMFAGKYGKYNWLMDSTNDGGAVGLGDFATFASHYGHMYP
jgi:hypothetical protein